MILDKFNQQKRAKEQRAKEQKELKQRNAEFQQRVRAAHEEVERRKKLNSSLPSGLPVPTTGATVTVPSAPSGTTIDDSIQRRDALLANRRTIITEGGLPESMEIGAPIIGEARDPTKIDLNDEQVTYMVQRADALEERLQLKMPDWERQSIQYTIIRLRQNMARRR